MASANTLENVFIIQDNRSPTEGKIDKRSFNKGTGRGANYRQIHELNFSSVAKLGLALRQVKLANEVVGSYTNNRLRQRRVERLMTFAQYGVGIAVAGPIGVAYAAGDIAYRSLNYAIRNNKHNEEAAMKRDISGIAARSMSRTSGIKI